METEAVREGGKWRGGPHLKRLLSVNRTQQNVLLGGFLKLEISSKTISSDTI